MPYESSEDPSNLYTRNQLIQTRPDHITTRPVCHSDFYTVHLHAMTTLTILSTPTKLTNLSTLTISTDYNNYQEDKYRIRISRNALGNVFLVFP